MVVPITYHHDPIPNDFDEESLPRKRNAGSWTCAVILSDDPSYPAGGYRIVIGTDELVRGTEVSIKSMSS
ncbi:hypothetical protein [Amycolatopsis sp. CA-230715]|uniref:hypothetical protein n=1 Tax=Amycolatopsis sp. CA-230715 TaxID=2745196 RepID=UPI001C0196B3|nr:hypothetical protein [Amycolatopsis sp. CA-230715]QWF85741.1 hypothetical protein HUW46_09221 [Amycolatopsis sp. CA-230715]